MTRPSTIVVANPWTPFGLSDDPFFQQPLQPTDDEHAQRPMSLFVGREDDISLLASQIVGSSSSRAIVEGPAGVGKTSFVNRLKTVLSDHKVLTHVQPVRVVPRMTPRVFQGEVIKVLIAINRTINATQGTAGKVKEAAKAEASLGEADKYWRRVSRITEGEDSTSGGISTAIIGMQRERIRIPAELEGLTLFDEINEGFRHLAKSGYRVLIHVNNLENLSREDAVAAAGLIQDVRDTFFADHSHWLFVGTTGIEEQVFRGTPQVDGIIPFTVTLGALLPSEVAELLERRYRHLQLGTLRTRPIPVDVAADLYERYQGNLRDFLRLLSNAVQHHARKEPGVPLSVADVVAEMAPLMRPAKIVKRIGELDASYLEKTLRGTGPYPEFRVTEVVQRNPPITQAGASKLVRRLVDAGVIAARRKEGASIYYGLTHGDLTIALGLM